MEPVIDRVVRPVDFRVRLRQCLTRQRALRGRLEIGERACSDGGQQCRAVRPALFTIDGRHGKTKDICLELANEGTLRAAARQQQLTRREAKLLENGEGVAQREAYALKYGARHVST